MTKKTNLREDVDPQDYSEGTWVPVPKPKYFDTKPVEQCRSMPVQFGPVKAQVFGGPFKEYRPGQRRVVSVKMAAEVNHPHDISIPTRDFKVPKLSDMHAGIAKALEAIVQGNDLYAGCMMGVGRTGLFMACLAKVMLNYAEQKAWDFLSRDELKKNAPLHPAIIYVRKHYNSHAVETDDQKQFVSDFDTQPHVDWLTRHLGPKVVERVVVKEVPIYVFNPLKAWFQFWGLDKR
jgi:hypothetical protein